MAAVSRPATAINRLSELVEWVAEHGSEPANAHHVAVLLEMGGWTDRRAVALGFDDVFALAEAVYDLLRTRVTSAPVVPRERVNWLKAIWHTFMLYLRGLTFAAPMLLSSYAVLTLEYSIWSYTGFSTEVATGIALGTFGSFLVAGGFTQAIARRGLFYLSQNLYALARKASVQLLIVGISVTLGAAVVGTVLMVLIPILPWAITKIALLYYLFLSVIWLGVGLLYMLQRVIIVLGMLAVGVGLVHVQIQFYGVPIMLAQVVGMFVIAVSTMAIGLLLMTRLTRRDETDEGSKAVMPRWSQVSRSLAPYFLYGVLYFILLFSDRMMAWSVPGEFHPYVIWFLGDYELGLDWALWTLVLPMGMVEVYIHVVFSRITRRQPITGIADLDSFNRRFRREHVQMNLMIFVAGLASLGLVLYGMNLLQETGLLPIDPLASSVTRFVFFVAAVAFIVITVGLQNALILFSLNVPWPAVRACASAVLVNLAVGFLASRYGFLISGADGHQWAILGLLSGAIVFAIHTFREAYQVLGNLDFHLMRSV